jgi:hypothetical protein
LFTFTSTDLFIAAVADLSNCQNTRIWRPELMLSDRPILIFSSEFLVLNGSELWCLAQPVVLS